MIAIAKVSVCGIEKIGGFLFALGRVLAWVTAWTFAASMATAASPEGAVTANPRLESMQVEIWPEYDRASTALVLMKGLISPSVTLPAAVVVRIPASAGTPSAVAYSAAGTPGLNNLQYTEKKSGEFNEIRFQATERFFQVEFYEPLKTTAPERIYTYRWTGGFAADRLQFGVQEPATAKDLAVDPSLGEAKSGGSGLRYLTSDLGAFAAGRALAVKVRYTKSDPRPSSEIIKPQQSAEPPVPAVRNVAPASAGVDAGSGKTELVVALIGGGIGIGLLVWLVLMRIMGREEESDPVQPNARFCLKCKARIGRRDRFCSKCGAKVS